MRFHIISVHGTFARGAAWTQPDSSAILAAQTALGDGTTYETFLWSGANSYAGRKEGATALARRLSQIQYEEAEVKIVLIGHSHGGNVILGAISDVHASSRVSAIVTLGTPFLEVSLKNQLSPALLAIGASLWTIPILYETELLFSLWGLLVVVAVALGLYFPLRSAKSQAESAPWLGGSQSPIGLPMLCLRHTSDEASFWLNWLSVFRLPESLISGLSSIFFGGTLISALFVAILFMSLFGIGLLDVFLYAGIAFSWFLLPASIFSSFTSLHRFGYGSRPSLRNLFLAAGVRESPSGGMIQTMKLSGIAAVVRNSILRKRLITPHSLGYRDEKAVKAWASWLSRTVA